jgi:hypothetical protein
MNSKDESICYHARCGVEIATPDAYIDQEAF